MSFNTTVGGGWFGVIVPLLDCGQTKAHTAPLFNLEHLLSKPIPELEGSGFNLSIEFSV